jgi:hypothetical protein
MFMLIRDLPKKVNEPAHRRFQLIWRAEPSAGRVVMRCMETTLSSALESSKNPIGRIGRSVTALCALALASACVSAPSTTGYGAGAVAGADPAPPTDTAAPTFAELYDTYFAKGTPGHCATSGCHDDPGHNVWLCGTTAEACYSGMIGVGLIDPTDPTHSEIADPKLSPLTWVNSAGGTMPLDAQGDNAEGRAAIEAWVAAGATNDP